MIIMHNAQKRENQMYWTTDLTVKHLIRVVRNSFAANIHLYYYYYYYYFSIPYIFLLLIIIEIFCEYVPVRFRNISLLSLYTRI